MIGDWRFRSVLEIRISTVGDGPAARHPARSPGMGETPGSWGSTRWN